MTTSQGGYMDSITRGAMLLNTGWLMITSGMGEGYSTPVLLDLCENTMRTGWVFGLIQLGSS